MKNVDVQEIREKIREACGRMAVVYHPDILDALKQGREKETEERSVTAMDMLLQNAEIAAQENIPICQDTGMVIVWAEIGQDVHLVNGDFEEAVNAGVAEGYTQNYLRASVVKDPLLHRENTKNNTPCVIYARIVPGDSVKISLMAKGFGSENMSRIAMLKPAQGVQGVKDFVLETIKLAGPNACPPMIAGVGIGGTFDSCAAMAKHALLRPLNVGNPDPEYKALEETLLQEANALKVGPMGLHGNTTALKIQIETAPTHIAGMPCAVNICCHACRHEEFTL